MKYIKYAIFCLRKIDIQEIISLKKLTQEGNIYHTNNAGGYLQGMREQGRGIGKEMTHC